MPILSFKQINSALLNNPTPNNSGSEVGVKVGFNIPYIQASNKGRNIKINHVQNDLFLR